MDFSHVCDADQQRTKGVSHKVKCLHVSTGEFCTNKRITAHSSKRFNVHCLSACPTACGLSIFLRKRLTLRSTPTFRENTTYRVESRPDFSRYLFDESWRRFTEFRGNPGCIVCHGGVRDEGKMRVERGLKCGKGTQTSERYGIVVHDKHNIFPTVRDTYWRNMFTARKHTNCIHYFVWRGNEFFRLRFRLVKFLS